MKNTYLPEAENDRIFTFIGNAKMMYGILILILVVMIILLIRKNREE